MVGQGHAQGLAGGLEAAGELGVLAAGGGVAAGMVVVGEGRGGAIAQGLAEELPRADQRRGGRALAEDALGQQVALGVESQQAEALLRPALAARQQVGAGGPGAGDPRALGAALPAPGQLRGGPELAGLGGAWASSTALWPRRPVPQSRASSSASARPSP